jgi:uncharacterized protein involved in exopolysaccharide biosynthesis
MATQAEVESTLASLEAQFTKVAAEINAEIATLQAELANAGGSTPAMDASLARLQAIADALDALNPDVPA